MPDSNLSPAAQAVLDAFDTVPLTDNRRLHLAAALRAAALICTRERRTLMAIADELEGVKYGTYRCNLEDKPQ